MKIIFLDVDGVLNTDHTKERVPKYRFIGIEDQLVENLKYIVDETGAEIVLSSSWKNGWCPKYHGCEPYVLYLIGKLRRCGLRIIDKTSDIGNGWKRGAEIEKWLAEHDVDEWVILDDEVFVDYSNYTIRAHWVKTSFEHGLTKERAKRAVKVLSGDVVTIDEYNEHLDDGEREHFGIGIEGDNSRV